jgi:CHASE3 domain sensor protein
VLRTLFSFRRLIFVFGLVALGLPIALVAQLGTVRTLNTTTQGLAVTRQGAFGTVAVLRYQLDEESGVRGYAATGQKVFLQPFEDGRAAMSGALDQLDRAIPDNPTGAADQRADRALRELRRFNAEWLATIADPIIAGAHDKNARLLRGKALIDRFRGRVDLLNEYFADRYRTALAVRDGTMRTTTIVSVFAIVAIALEIVVFGAVILQMRRELDREHGFVEALQSAASVRLVPPPHLGVGAAYRSATRGTRIGGDVYDVYRLDADRTLLVVGDVSGKGIVAAVDTTFVRFAIRALAGERLAPDAVLQRFDALYCDANPAPESFVTVFVGIHDRRDASLVYSNAGHEACWVRHGADIEMLAPTGPIVGLGQSTFLSGRTRLAAGDLLVLATDGLTEARTPQGTFISIERITTFIAQARGGTPQELVDELVALIARYTRGRINDDLAILAVEPLT